MEDRPKKPDCLKRRRSHYSKYNCKCIDEESEINNVEDSEETTIKEVVWNSEKKDWLDKEKK